MTSDSDSATIDTEPVPPTLHVATTHSVEHLIQEELEKINDAIAEVNRLNTDFLLAKNNFSQTFEAAKEKLYRLYFENKQAVDKCRPFYRARAQAYKAKYELLKSAAQYRNVTVAFDEARENAASAEKALHDSMSSTAGRFSGALDPDILTNLNKANEKVAEVAKEKALSTAEQEQRIEELTSADGNMAEVAHELRKYILRARPYFEEKENLQKQLDLQYSHVREKYKLLGEAKLKHKQLFNGYMAVSAEFEQRICSPEEMKARDLSRFEEIPLEDIGEELDIEHNMDVPGPSTGLSVPASSSGCSTDAETISETSSDVDSRDVRLSTSLDEVHFRDYTLDEEDLEKTEPYSVSFQMKV